MGTTTKALTLLSFFDRTRQNIGLSEMARLSGINKATAHRLLTELADMGFVEQAGAGREYRLGPAVLRLAALRDHQVPMREMAMQCLTTLSEQTGETAHMSLLSGAVLSSFAYSYSDTHGSKVMMDGADVLDFHATGSGLAVLAHSSDDLINRILSTPLPRRTVRTETDPDAIRSLLPPIRTCGIAESIGGYEMDVHSFAAPLFDSRGHCFGALAVATPVSRMTDRLKQQVCEALFTQTAELTRLLGGFPPDTYPTFLRGLPLQTGG